MLRINKLIRYIIGGALGIIAIIGSGFNFFHLVILQGSIFVLTLLLALVLDLSERWLTILGCSLFLVSGIAFLLGQADASDLIATVGFKIILIAVLCATVNFLKHSDTTAD